MTARAAHEWRRRVAAEYRSACLTAQATHWLLMAGAEDELIDASQKIIRDELAHSDLCHQVSVDAGGADSAAPLEVQRLAQPWRGALLPSLVELVFVNHCLGETFAVPLFRAMARVAEHKAAKHALQRIVQDEARHRAFGWAALDHLLGSHPETRTLVRANHQRWLSNFSEGYAPTNGQEVPLSSDDRAWGLLTLAETREAFLKARDGEVARRMTSRNLT